ncbi:MAG: hypothetical protein ACK49E_15300, partial [Planctomyces sp.]
MSGQRRRREWSLRFLLVGELRLPGDSPFRLGPLAFPEVPEGLPGCFPLADFFEPFFPLPAGFLPSEFSRGGNG